MEFRALNTRQTHEILESMEEAVVMMIGFQKERNLKGLEMFEAQIEDTLRLINYYSMLNVSDIVLRIIMSYTDYVNCDVWQKRTEHAL